MQTWKELGTGEPRQKEQTPRKKAMGQVEVVGMVIIGKSPEWSRGTSEGAE